MNNIPNEPSRALPKFGVKSLNGHNLNFRAFHYCRRSIYCNFFYNYYIFFSCCIGVV